MTDRAEELFHEGTRHLAAHDAPRAEACFRAAIDADPGLAEAHANLAWLLDAAHRDDAADASYRRALELAPAQAAIHRNHGALLARLQRFGEAEGAYAQAIALEPEAPAHWSNLAALYAQMARYDAAEVCCRRSLELDPGYAKAQVNLAYLCLRDGRFAEGWGWYESRGWAFDPGYRIDASRWRGEALDGRSILVGHEGGHGDLIQFCRYATLLKRESGAGRVTLLSPPALVGLLGTLEGVDAVLPLDTVLDRGGFDRWVSAMSLPGLFGTTLETIPLARPYLRVPPAPHRLPPRGAALRVGLVWKGSAGFENDADRSLASLRILDPLASVDCVQFISLQKGQGEDEVRMPLGKLRPLALGDQLSSFADTAALLGELDLVIAVDTAVAHLAGALGVPCWLMLPWHMPDWRWLADREDSPWYPGSMRLFRQGPDRDWRSVVERMRAELALLARG